jgi:sugar lactone lactonase YvrE
MFMKLLNPKYSIAILTILLFTLFTFTVKAQTIKTVAGNGNYGYSGDGGSATATALNYPSGVAVDASGNLFIADYHNNRIRKVSTSGVITTVAGNGTFGYIGDGGSATSAELNYPYGMAVDASGNLFIADTDNSRIRKVSTSGIITTVAGNGNYWYSGDGGSAIYAELNQPSGVAVDDSGNLFIADQRNNVIRKVSTSGIITTVAGNGTYGYSGDGGSADSAELAEPSGVVVVDASGNLFIADNGNVRIRKVSTSGIITTVAGNGTGGYSGDGGSADSAELGGPASVAVDASGNLFIADEGTNVIRKVSTTGIITTVAGNGTFGFSGDGGSAASAELYGPSGVAVDASGNLFIADYNNSRIREVTGGTVPVSITNYELRITNEKQVVNSWVGENEINVSHYNIQRITNSKDFATVGTVKAIGSGANSYSFTDNAPANGINYYRLQSVDKDGAATYSKVVSCELSVVSKPIAVYPNPSRDKVTISGNHIASVQVIDNIGRVVKVVSLKDATNPTLSVSVLPAGVYHLRVQTSDGGMSAVGFVKE